MYEHYFGFAKKPFDLSPDPSIVFNSDMHQEALAILRYGVVDRKVFLLLTGDVGTGKTTLLQVLVNSISDKTHLCLISNPAIAVDEFYYYMTRKFGMPEFEGNKAKFILDFSDYLKGCHQRGERVILIIDEAHVLSVDILEEIRLLSNQEYMEFGVMSIFLVGQPELNERLAHEKLLPLRQRIGIRFHLTPFSEENTKKYILFRLRKAGAQKIDFFTENALKMIHEETKGVPRLINIVCDQAMLTAFAESKPKMDSAIIKQCVKDLHIPGEKRSLPLPRKKDSTLISIFAGKFVANCIIIFTLILMLLLLGQAYWLFAPASWPGHEYIGQVHDLIISKGRMLWERYSTL